MEQRPKILKINLDAEIRRVGLTSTDFVSLQTQVAELFSLQPGTFSLKYKDDEGDLITLGSNEEYVEALNCCGDNILRLSVFKTEEHRHGGRHGHHRHHGHGHRHGHGGGRCGWKRRLLNHIGAGENPLGQLFPMIQQFAGNLIQGGNFDQILENLLKSDFCKLEQNYTCDGCNTGISGTRYHCENCPDFDFCSSCFEQKRATHDSSHNFKEVTALAALKDALARNDINIDAFLAPGKATDPVAKKTHHAFCDRCDAKIEGIRWKCFDCADFDFCNACYLVAAGKETIRSHQKEHSFAKIEEPCHIRSFPSLLAEHQNKKREEYLRAALLEKTEQKKKEEEERQLELERKKKEIEQQMEEERKKHEELAAKLVKERLELLQKQQALTQEKPKEEIVLDSLAPLRQQAKEEKQLNPFEQKLESLQAMGFDNRERNIQLLVKHNGEIFPVIQDLIN